MHTPNVHPVSRSSAARLSHHALRADCLHAPSFHHPRSAGIPRTTRMLAVAAAWVATVSSLAASASAADCDTTLSSCFDANAVDIPAGPSEFVSIENATVLAPGRFALGLAGSYLRKPVELVAPSPSPEGREISLVEDIWQLDLLAAIGVLPRLQVALAFPVRLVQNGTGIEGATSRQGNDLRKTAIVDPRIGASYAFLDSAVQAKLRFELKLPLGDEDSFAGTNGVELIPTLLASSRDLGPLHLAAEAGARFRQSATLGDTRIGNQLRFALGARYDVLPQLSVGAEAWILPSLASQPETNAGQGTYLPAEWLGSVGAHFVENVTLLAAAGTGIPLSSGPGSNDNELGVTSPTWRAFLAVRVGELGASANTATPANER